jgi:uncharacterized C2H2 Zn-finger protein
MTESRGNIITKISEVTTLIKNIESRKNKQVPCPICQQAFKNKTLCGGHIKYAHYKHLYIVVCDECELAWSDKRSLEEHNKKMHDPENPIIVYEKIKGREIIEYLKEIIQEDDRYICPICKVYDNDKIEYVKKHMWKKHEEDTSNKINPDIKIKSDAFRLITKYGNYYECPICEKIFDNQKGCSSHIAQQHDYLEDDNFANDNANREINNSPVDDKLITKMESMGLDEVLNSPRVIGGVHYCCIPGCERYKFGLSNRDSYRKHARTHFKSEYKYKCDLCEESDHGYMQLCELNKHKRRVHLVDV